MVITQTAATALIVREHPSDGIEVLLLKRNSKLAFAPNVWVFPGGRVDSADGATSQEHLETTAKITAARESMEEAQIKIDPNAMVHFCHWTTPKGENRRFATWFFHCQCPYNDQIQIDQSEIVDYKWISPQVALQQMKSGQLLLLPPTFLNLARITDCKNYEEVRIEFQRTGVIRVEPKAQNKDGLFIILYKGDSGYETNDMTKVDSSHRLMVDHKSHTYEFQYHNCIIPPIDGGVHLKV